MPLYVCFRGDCDNAALTEAGAFSLRDTQGRNWICYEAGEEHDTATLLMQAMQMQRKLHLQGMSSEGMYIREERCRDREELAERLGSR